jgi:5-amino-6-(5-phospho-D-ribitylamino)uracil phosphatase
MAELLPSWDTHDVASLRRFAAIRLIALDLDGTLVRPLTSDVYDTILKLQLGLSRQGVYVTIATGRTFEGVTRLLGDWGAQKDIPLILYNGSIVLSRHPLKTLSAAQIELSALDFVLGVCRKVGVTVLSYAFALEGTPLFERAHKTERVFGWTHGNRVDRELNGLRITWMDEWKAGSLPAPTAILIDVSKDSESAAYVVASLNLRPEISVTKSGAAYLEVRPRGSNKATALALVADYLGVDRAESLALGDNDNDVEVLRWCGTGVTISGASEGALAASDFVCRHGVAEGAVETLRLVKQAHRYFPGTKRS